MEECYAEEIDALHSQGTWSLEPNPGNKNIVGSKWLYKIKKNSDGSIARYKARLVAQGFSQQLGSDFGETFSPVVRHTTVRLILSLAAMNHWSLRQLDVKNAFLHGDLEEEVFMRQPQGYEDPAYPEYVCKLKKSLYGLKQAPRAWNAKFTGYLPALGFKLSHSDPSLFVKHEGSDVIVLLLYVDDIILTGSNANLVQTVVDDLSSVFEMKDMGRLAYFLGLQITYPVSGGLFVSQTKYAKDLLHKAGMQSYRACSTSCKPHNQILTDSGEPLSDPTMFRSVVGALQYLTFTRPDLAYAVNTVCQYMNSPTDVHWLLVKRILRYVQGTLSFGINFTSISPSVSDPWQLSAYSDADWAGDINTRRSTTGSVVFLGNNPIFWQSKKQGSVSRSSTEAEYRALANTAADIAWIRQVLQDVKFFLPNPPLVYCDNISALALSSNPVYHSRIKHLDIDYHFVREKVQKKDLLVQYVPTEEQVADVFTKGLHSPIFSRHCNHLRLGNVTR
ncbi:transposable element gene [Prunus dulcis]|uniref:Transposable element protein n=1 Tax=Prunus dulcis TaxID=3755 RepID=A0A4Y1QPR9_PRUDU|nr:transposable element gene [Prunus dulcis]